MSDQVENTQHEKPIATPTTEISTTIPTIVYVLYLVSFIIGITSIVGLIMAYVNKGDGNYLDSHYQFQIRTFWIGLLYSVIGVLLLSISIGVLVLIFTAIWLIVRCVVGFKYLGKKEPIPNPTSWMFG